MAETIIVVATILAGLAAGSFLNVVIHRGPVMWGLVDAPARGDFVAPRSYCPSCSAPLAAANLIPLLSYLAQRGKCTRCGALISPRYPIVEALGGVSALLSVIVFGWTPAALAAALFAFALIALAIIDLETGYLPDAITLPLLGAGLAANFAGLFTPVRDALIGAVAGFVVFWALGAVYARIRRREGLGLGDAKLLAALGAWTGWIALPAIVFIAAFGMLVVIAVASAAGRKRAADEPTPFGPALCAAGFAALYFGDRFLSAL